MNYQGKLYGKIANQYVELEGTSDQFDALTQLHQAVQKMRKAQKNYERIRDPKTVREKRKTEEEVDRLLRKFPQQEQDIQTLF